MADEERASFAVPEPGVVWRNTKDPMTCHHDGPTISWRIEDGVCKTWAECRSCDSRFVIVGALPLVRPR